MNRQRVLVTGMGADLGSRVASLLEAEPWVGQLVGFDVDPPRRRLRRAEFHLVDIADRDRIVELVTKFNPHVVVHLAVWEPSTRAVPADARRWTEQAATAFLGAAAECRALEAIVHRSGIEVYGRARGAPTRPDESSPLHPTSEYGRTLAMLEQRAASVGRRVGVSVGAVRLASVLGPHVPSPLGRLLRQPIVPFSLLADSPFAVVEDIDAARAIVAAAATRLAEPVNVVAPGAITGLQAALRGRRIPLATIGPEWPLLRRFSNLVGAPVPDHVLELMHRGRLADGARAAELLGIRLTTSTPEVIDRLHAWDSVMRFTPDRSVA
ncbi:MAG: NAD-dependent epimerase/dehydratase family protein [Ilumatobacteraceae bacterium]